MPKRFSNIRLLPLALILLANIYAQMALASNAYVEALPAWQNTLNRFVDDQGRVDFVALSRDTQELDKFVSAVAKISPKSHPEQFNSAEAVLSYHINAYNALAMRGVINRNIPKNFSSLLKRASFFKFRSVIIGGEKTNLYDYENKVIRPLGDGRVHFVLNCMVVDCPILLRKVFTPDTLDADLETATINFFDNPKYAQTDDAKKQVMLSSLLKFYTKDYVPSGSKNDLIGYVNQFKSKTIPADYTVKFMPYDWTINQQTSPNQK